MLQLKVEAGDAFLVMSAAALDSLSQVQRQTLLQYNRDLVASNLETIETLGGGSARCCLAEIFLPFNKPLN